MRFVLMMEAQQGLSYADQLAIARHVEDGGFEALFRSDHYTSFPGSEDNPTTDAWAVLAGLARETSRIGLAALVSPVTFRHPGNLAKLATTVDEMSGGRLEVGVGAGWNDVEHARYGFAFPDIGERADMLEETLEILHGLWEGPDGWSFEGRHWQVRDARTRPRPADLPERAARGETRPRLIVGGDGKPRSLRIAARYAEEFNVTSSGPEMVASVFERLDATLDAAGRDRASIARSAMVGVLIGRDAAEVKRREAELLRTIGAEEAGDEWFAARRTRWVHGTPDEARAMVRRFAETGAERLMLQDFLPWDLDHIDLIAEELVGKV